MRCRLLGVTAVLCLLVPVLPLRAGETKNAPAIIVRMKSIDQQMADAEYLGNLGGGAEQVKAFMAMYKAKLKGKSLEGIDVTRPIGIHASIGNDLTDSKIVFLLPIADQQAFLAGLKDHGIPMDKAKDGLYTMNVPNAAETSKLWDQAIREAIKAGFKFDVGPMPDPIYVRFADKYAHITFGNENKGLLDPKKLTAVSKILPANVNTSLSVSLAIDQLPADKKKSALAIWSVAVAMLKKEKEPEESAAKHRLRTTFGAEIETWVKMLDKEAGELTIALDVDRKNSDLALSLGLEGKPGTKLAKSIAALGDARSVSAGLAGKESAMSMFMHVKLPEGLRKAWEQYVNEDLQQELLKEANMENRALQEALFKVMKPTLLGAELDIGLDVRGPSKKGLYAGVLAVKVQDGPAVMKTMLANIAKKDAMEIELDVAKFGAISIHKIKKLEEKKQEKETIKFGEGPGYFAARDDALMMSFGDGALEALKIALASKPAPTKIYALEMSVARFPKLFGGDEKAHEEAAKKAFGDDPNADRIRMTLEGGKSLRMSYSMSAPLITYFQMVNQKKLEEPKR